jgi:hypothetical protein
MNKSDRAYTSDEKSSNIYNQRNQLESCLVEEDISFKLSNNLRLSTIMNKFRLQETTFNSDTSECYEESNKEDDDDAKSDISNIIKTFKKRRRLHTESCGDSLSDKSTTSENTQEDYEALGREIKKEAEKCDFLSKKRKLESPASTSLKVRHLQNNK